MIIDLSPMMIERVRNYGHKIDRRLLSECGYYPRGGCQDCSWESPNPDCRWSHILIDTRINPTTSSTRIKIKTQRKSTPTKPTKKNTLWGVGMEKVLATLPPSVKREFEELVAKYVG